MNNERYALWILTLLVIVTSVQAASCTWDRPICTNIYAVNITDLDATINGLDARELADNTTQAVLINNRAFPGSCAAGTVVQNTTINGVECVTVTAGASDGTGGWINTSTETNTSLTVNINSNFLTFANNYGVQWANNTGGVFTGLYPDTENNFNIGSDKQIVIHTRNVSSTMVDINASITNQQYALRIWASNTSATTRAYTVYGLLSSGVYGWFLGALGTETSHAIQSIHHLYLFSGIARNLYIGSGATVSTANSFVIFDQTEKIGINPAGVTQPPRGLLTLNNSAPQGNVPVLIIGAHANTTGNIIDVSKNGTEYLKLNASGVLHLSNKSTNRCTLVAGDCQITNTAVTANTNIFCTNQISSGTPGTAPRVETIIAGSYYNITTDQVLDTSTIACMIVETI